MTLRFEVDQADCFRRGVNAPKSTVHLEVDPQTLPQAERDLIADRLHGIDVCRLDLKRRVGEVPQRITAKGMTYKALLEAIIENENKIPAQ